MRWTLLFALVFTLALATAGTAAAQRPGDIRREAYTLELGDREIATELARLTVPASRSRADDGATIEIAYVVLPATTSSPGSPIVYLDGGPGGAGISAAAIPYMGELFDALRQLGDVVLIDQRGTGRSIPRLACALEEPVPGDVFASRARMLELSSAVASQCAERFRAQGIDLSDYDTVESADDLDDLRRAIGAERISLLGFSYGTHLALATMRRHGERLDRVVLIGTEGPGETYKLPSTFDTQIRTLSALAAGDPKVSAEVPDLEGMLRRVIERFEREPASVTVTDPKGEKSAALTIGAEGLLYLLRRDIGDTNDLVWLPALIHELAAGGTELLEELAAKRYGQLIRGISVMSIAMDCASGVDAERRRRIESETPGSIFGPMTNLLDPEICASVDVADLGAEYRSALESDVPTLFVSGTLDSNTPPWQAEEARKGIPNSAHLVVENAGHESTLPVPEVQASIARFLAGESLEDRRIALPALEFEPIGTKG